jgi:hypothetical protein
LFEEHKQILQLDTPQAHSISITSSDSSAATLDEDLTRFGRIEKEIKEIKSLLTYKSKSYAQALSSPAPLERILPPRRTKREEVRKERAKLEITLSTKNCPEEIKADITSKSPDELNASLQLAIDSASLEDNQTLSIVGARSLQSSDVRISCKTQEDVSILKKQMIPMPP